MQWLSFFCIGIFYFFITLLFYYYYSFYYKRKRKFLYLAFFLSFISIRVLRFCFLFYLKFIFPLMLSSLTSCSGLLFGGFVSFGFVSYSLLWNRKEKRPRGHDVFFCFLAHNSGTTDTVFLIYIVVFLLVCFILVLVFLYFFIFVSFLLFCEVVTFIFFPEK